MDWVTWSPKPTPISLFSKSDLFFQVRLPGGLGYLLEHHLQPFTVYGSEWSIGPLLISMNQPMDLWRNKKLDQKSMSPILLTNSWSTYNWDWSMDLWGNRKLDLLLTKNLLAMDQPSETEKNLWKIWCRTIGSIGIFNRDQNQTNGDHWVCLVPGSQKNYDPLNTCFLMVKSRV